MELWIRSQDREAIVKPINIFLENPLNSGETGIRGYFSNNSYKMLGYYKTKERALEVLNEIQRLIEDLQYIGYAIENEKFCAYRPNVYNMPEK